MRVRSGTNQAKHHLRTALGAVALIFAGAGIFSIINFNAQAEELNLYIPDQLEEFNPNPDLTIPEIKTGMKAGLRSATTNQQKEDAVVADIVAALEAYDGSKKSVYTLCATASDLNACVEENDPYSIVIENPFTEYTPADGAELRDLFSSLYFNTTYEHPELFWAASGLTMGFYYKNNVVTEILLLPMLLEEFETPATLTAGKQRFNNAFAEWKTAVYGDDVDEMTELEKILSVHDTVLDRNNYTLAVALGESDYNYIVHSAYATLVNRDSVCQGIAGAINLLLNDAGVETYTVVNDNHAWNRVKVNGKFYNVDATNDDPFQTQGINAKHELFLTSDSEYGALMEFGSNPDKVGVTRFGVTAPEAYPDHALWKQVYAPFHWDDDADALVLLDNNITATTPLIMGGNPAAGTKITLSFTNIKADGSHEKHVVADFPAVASTSLLHDSVVYYRDAATGNAAAYNIATGALDNRYSVATANGYFFENDGTTLRHSLINTSVNPYVYMTNNDYVLPTDGLKKITYLAPSAMKRALANESSHTFIAEYRNGTTRNVTTADGVQIIAPASGNPIAYYQGQAVRFAVEEPEEEPEQPTDPEQPEQPETPEESETPTEPTDPEEPEINVPNTSGPSSEPTSPNTGVLAEGGISARSAMAIFAGVVILSIASFIFAHLAHRRKVRRAGYRYFSYFYGRK